MPAASNPILQSEHNNLAVNNVVTSEQQQRTSMMSSQEKKMKHDDEETITPPELDLKLNLSPPGTTTHYSSPSSFVERSPASSSSCVSRELSPTADDNNGGAEVIPMMLVGCPGCLMYVMVTETNPKCPKCNSTVLLDFFHHDRLQASFK